MEQLLINLFAGVFVGGAAGLLYGLVLSFTSRDGIWPDMWAVLIAAGMTIGGGIGAVHWLLS